MTESKTQFPILKWAQRKDKLFITISVVHSKKPIVDLTDGKRIKYQGTDGNINYAFDIELYDEINKEESKYTLESRNIFLNLKKKTSGPYWPRLIKDEKKYHWIEVDWMYYAEEDEEDEATNPNKPGQGFDDMPDMGDDEMDEDDEPNPVNEDDKKEEEQKKEEENKEEPKKDEPKKEEEKKEETKEESKKEEEKKE
jgi:prostaglandin-E synthase